LAARLARETSLSVVVFEAERFPRDHIGESFVHWLIPNLEASGALPKVLASECWVKKYGGYYAWDPNRPWATWFEHGLYEQDGYRRWAIHVNRSEFDQILLDHARACGAAVFEETPVTAVAREGDLTRVSLGERGEVRCRLLVNASGRTGNTTISGEKSFLSQYRNIAIWGHMVGGLPAQSVAGDWNIFREEDLSPIGNFAFDDGWVWYIPVPKIVDGKRVRTHSVGIVTDPAVLKRDGQDYRDPATFMATLRSIPLLRELIGDATLIDGGALQTATNYSRISGTMCDWDRKEIRIGDEAFFVDPLFSSGVNFAVIHASAAVTLIKAAFDERLPEQLERDLWTDYEVLMHGSAHAFAQGIDQWYSEIARDNPNSPYWRERAAESTFDGRRETFHALVNGMLHGDLLQVITKGSRRTDALDERGSLRRSLDTIARELPPPTARIWLKPGLQVRESMTLDPGVPPSSGPPPGGPPTGGPPTGGPPGGPPTGGPPTGGPPTGGPPTSGPPGGFPGGPPKPIVHAFGPYWDDPVAHSGEVMHLFEFLLPCHRVSAPDDPEIGEVKFVEPIHGGLELLARLAEPQLHAELVEQLSPLQRHLLTHLALAGMLESEPGD
jgi:flavin-dependent dehydrogenase